MCIYAIDNPYIIVIDSMVHCAKSKKIQVIVHPNMKSVEKIEECFAVTFEKGRTGPIPATKSGTRATKMPLMLWYPSISSKRARCYSLEAI